MATSFTTKRKVVQHCRALQAQRFRPFLKRQWCHIKFEIWPVVKKEVQKGYRFSDDYLGDQISLSKMIVLTALLFIALYLFGMVEV
jgi:hypothetical protein